MTASVGYYPGCSAHGTGKEYEQSLKVVTRALAVQLREVPDWLCCGASSAHAIDRNLALALSGDTLAKARDAGLDQVLAPCAMCYSRLATAVHELHEDPALAVRLDRALGREPSGLDQVKALSLLDWLNAMPDEALAAPVRRPLAGLKVACYYGCLLVRPRSITGAANAEAPRDMERVVRLLGGEPVRWTMAVECCGGSFALSDKDVVLRQGRIVVDHARSAGADVVAVACPMCQANLDMRQAEFSPKTAALPVLYLTQLMGLAYGASEKELGFPGHFVSPGPTLAAVAARTAAEAAAKAAAPAPRAKAAPRPAPAPPAETSSPAPKPSPESLPQASGANPEG